MNPNHLLTFSVVARLKSITLFALACIWGNRLFPALKTRSGAGLGIGFASSQVLRYEIKDLAARCINPPEGLLCHLNIIAPRQSVQSRIAKAFLKLCVN